LIIYRSIRLRIRNVSDKCCREKQNTHLCPITLIFESLAVYEIMWKHVAEPGRPQMTIWRMRIACWIHMATNTLSEYVSLYVFPCNNGCTTWPHYVVHTLPVLSSPKHPDRNAITAHRCMQCLSLDGATWRMTCAVTRLCAVWPSIPYDAIQCAHTAKRFAISPCSIFRVSFDHKTYT
jgi:hypothetical protein